MTTSLMKNATLVALMAIPAAAAHAEPRRLSLTEALQIAVKDGREAKVAALGVVAAEKRTSGAAAQRLPVLRTEGNILYWDRPLDVAFGPMQPMSMGPSPTLRVRDQLTWQVSVTLAQPISALLVINRLVELERAGAAAAQADLGKARLDTAQRVAEAYLRLLQAKAFADVAEKSVAQVEAQLSRATIMEKGGILGKVDVLRLVSARDSARQALLRARTGVTVATSGLALTLDWPASTELDVNDDLPDPPPAVTWNDKDAVVTAGQERPELVAARERAEQARAGRGVAKSRLLPNLMGVATYQHTEGQAAFVPRDAFFVGATLSWDLWDWGKNWDGVKEAEARAEQAVIGERMLADQIAFDAQRRLLEARTAYETLGPARSSLEAATEAHRIQTVRFAEGAATTTDVLDAETDLSRARTAYAQARYDYYLAQASLARALGRLPSVGPAAAPQGGTK